MAAERTGGARRATIGRAATRRRRMASSLCVENEALDIIRTASSTMSRVAPTEDDTAHEDDTRNMFMPSARRRVAVGSSRAGTSFEIVKTP